MGRKSGSCHVTKKLNSLLKRGNLLLEKQKFNSAKNRGLCQENLSLSLTCTRTSGQLDLEFFT